jgi:hypothetical protein
MIRLIPCLLAVFVMGDALYAGGDETDERRVMVVRKMEAGSHGDREVKLKEIRKRLEKVNRELAELRAMMHDKGHVLHVTPRVGKDPRRLRQAMPRLEGRRVEVELDVCRECDGECQCGEKKRHVRIERRVMATRSDQDGVFVLREAGEKKHAKYKKKKGAVMFGGMVPPGGPDIPAAKLKELCAKQKHYAAAARKAIEKGDYESAAKHAHLAAKTGKAIEAAKKVMAARAAAARRHGPGPGGPSFGVGGPHPMEARMKKIEKRLDRIEAVLKRLVADKKRAR